MAWTTPRTWVTGEVVTAAEMNTHVRDNMNALAAIPSNQTTAAAPTGTNSSTAVMMGLAASCTPVVNGHMVVFASGVVVTTTNTGITIGIAVGTGSAPTNGAAATGSIVGTAAVFDAQTLRLPWAIQGFSNGVVGTAYWFDLQLTSSGGFTTSLTKVTMNIIEVA